MNPKIFTLDFVTGQLRLALVAVLAYGGGRGWFTPADATFITAIAGALGPLLIPWAWSIAVNAGKVSVASGSAAAAVAAVEKIDPASASTGAASAMQASKVATVLLIAFALSAFLAVPSAQAQTKKPAMTGNPIADIKTDLGLNQGPVKLTGNVDKDAQAIWDKIVAASQADLAYASKMAAVAGTPASGIRKQCYDAIYDLNVQVNGQNVKDASGAVIPKPDPKLFTDVESLAETIDNLSPQGKLFTSCAGMAQMTKTNTLTLINSIVTGAAGLAAMPVIPGL